jgi:hypothetical protein
MKGFKGRIHVYYLNSHPSMSLANAIRSSKPGVWTTTKCGHTVRSITPHRRRYANHVLGHSPHLKSPESHHEAAKYWGRQFDALASNVKPFCVKLDKLSDKSKYYIGKAGLKLTSIW